MQRCGQLSRQWLFEQHFSSLFSNSYAEREAEEATVQGANVEVDDKSVREIIDRGYGRCL